MLPLGGAYVLDLAGADDVDDSEKRCQTITEPSTNDDWVFAHRVRDEMAKHDLAQTVAEVVFENLTVLDRILTAVHLEDSVPGRDTKIESKELFHQFILA